MGSSRRPSYVQAKQRTPVTSDDSTMSPMAAEGRSPRLQIRGMSKSFGNVEALRDVDLDVGVAEVVALVGDNGAGKTTLIKALAGVQPADTGTIFVDGQQVSIRTPQDAVAVGIETVYQDLALCDNLDVVANLFLGRELRVPDHGILSRFLANKQMAMRAKTILQELSVKIPSLRTPVGNLSGGQRQSIAVGRAVLWGSRLVVMDEPTAALGVQQTAMVYRLINTLKQRGISVLVISHNMVDVFEVADRVYALRLGENAGVFDTATSSSSDVISAITGSDLVNLDRTAS